MKTIKLLALYAIIFAFGEGFGYLKNESWNIRDWGYNSSKYVSLWWIIMGAAVTAWYVVAIVMDDQRKRNEMKLRGQGDRA